MSRASPRGLFSERVLTLTFEQVEEIIGQRLVEIFGDPAPFPFEQPRFARLGRGRGSAVPAYDNLFAGVDLIDQTGQVDFGSMDVDMHGAAPLEQRD